MTGRAIGHQDQAGAGAVRGQLLTQSRGVTVAAGRDSPCGCPQLRMLGVRGDVATRKVAGNHDRRRQRGVTWLPPDQSWNDEVAAEAGG